MSTTLKTAQEILASKNKRGIRDIPQTVRAGVRMTKTQLRFCMIVCGIAVIALIIVMMIAVSFLYLLERAVGTSVMIEDTTVTVRTLFGKKRISHSRLLQA